MLYAFFWVIPRRLNFICRRFGTLCLFHLHRRIDVEFYIYPTMKIEQTECSETSAYKIQTQGNYPEESIKHSEHGESLKSGRSVLFSVIQGIPSLLVPPSTEILSDRKPTYAWKIRAQDSDIKNALYIISYYEVFICI